MIYNFKTLQIGTLTKLIFPFHIYIVHQNIRIGIYHSEHTRSLNSIRCLLFIPFMFCPSSRRKRSRCCQLDTISMSFCFIKHIEDATFQNNIRIYTRFTIGWKKQLLWLTYQVREIIICICIIYNILSFPMFHRPVYHIFTDLRIINCLWSPYSFQIILTRVFFLNINYT